MKFIKQLLVIGLIGIFLVGCAHFKQACMSDAEIKSSLNLYCSYWDGFRGALTEGNVYKCENSEFSPDLRLKVLQVLSKGEVLVVRAPAYDRLEKISELAVFHVLTMRTYADDAALVDGDYVCVGTYQYTTREDKPKTVYSLMEKALYEESRKNKPQR